jgi:hypothetical protein
MSRDQINALRTYENVVSRLAEINKISYIFIIIQEPDLLVIYITDDV